jgi:hypothetical protein
MLIYLTMQTFRQLIDFALKEALYLEREEHTLYISGDAQTGVKY